MPKAAENIIKDIRSIHARAGDPKSDGWTQNFYKEQLIAIKNELDKVSKETLKLNGEVEW